MSPWYALPIASSCMSSTGAWPALMLVRHGKRCLKSAGISVTRSKTQRPFQSVVPGWTVFDNSEMQCKGILHYDYRAPAALL